MFNYFNELKDKFKISNNQFNSYKLVNVGGNLIYLEGHLGLIVLSESVISFKIKNGKIEIKGNNLKLKDLSPDTVVIQGKIYKTEVF